MLTQIYKQLANVSKLLWQKGFAEANGGNISINITEFYKKTENELYLLITASGIRARQLAKAPEEGTVIVKFTNDFDNYEIIKGNLKPSSELISHYKMHQVLLKNNLSQKVIIHAHLPKVVALSHQKNFNNKQHINKLLFNIHPEFKLFLPTGVGLVNYCTPGSLELAEKTCKQLNNHKIVIWQKHGALACGNNFEQAFDYLDMLEKAIEMYIYCLQMGNLPEDLPIEELNKLEEIGKRF